MSAGADPAGGDRAGATPPRLAFDGLVGGYGGVTVIHGISGSVAPGEVLCVIGRNGVGKSTLMKMLFGQLACREGSVAEIQASAPVKSIYVGAAK